MRAIRATRSIIETSQKLVDGEARPGAALRRCQHRGLVQLSSMAIPRPANALIKKDNPEESDELLAFAIAKMKEYGIVDSGDSEKHGIGAMSDARWQDFFDVMSGQGLYPKDMNYQPAYTLRFVNQRVGMELQEIERGSAASAIEARRQALPQRDPGAGRGRSRGRARRVREPARPLGLRQEHAAAHHRRPRAAELGQGDVAAARPSPARSASSSRSRR